MRKLWLGIISALLSALMFVVWQWRAELITGAQAALDVQQLRASFEQQQERWEATRREQQALDQQLSELREALQVVQETREQDRKAIDELRQSDEEYRDWSDEPLPDVVIRAERMLDDTHDSDGNAH